jgi:hypothetical protein
MALQALQPRGPLLRLPERPGEKMRVRFLRDFDEPFAITFHQGHHVSFRPCATAFKRKCPKKMHTYPIATIPCYLWPVWTYDYDEQRLLVIRNTPGAWTLGLFGDLLALYERESTITDRDLVVWSDEEAHWRLQGLRPSKFTIDVQPWVLADALRMLKGLHS